MPRSTTQLRLRHVKTVRRNGRAYLYFNTGQMIDGKPVRRALPAIDDPKFAAAYAAALANRTRTRNLMPTATVAQLIHAYQKSDKFRRRAGGTQRTYAVYMARLESEMGIAPVTGVLRRDVRAFLNKIDGSGARKMALAVCKLLFTFAVMNDWRDDDPTHQIEVEHEAVPHEPWPDALIEAALSDPAVDIYVGLFLFTGQRIGDVRLMRWTDIRDGVISGMQQKTGFEYEIPIHRRLADILDRYPRGLTTILCKANGMRLSEDAIRMRLQKWAAARGQFVVPHGLRKNAVNALLEAGCSVGEVSSLTGQSLQMVEHYAKRRNNKKLARAAMARWENDG